MLGTPDVTDRTLADLLDMRGRSVVITGAAWGLGRAMARRFAEAGASVLIGDVDEAKAAQTAAEIAGAHDAPVLAMPMDVTRADMVLAVADRAVAEFGGIDVWVNNAGIPLAVPLLDMAGEDWDRIMAVNLRGLFLGAREAARRMIAGGRRGVIVNIASLAGYRGIGAGQAAYVTSKHGVRGATRQMALELGGHGIRVLGVAPGYCQTEHTAFIADLTPEERAKIDIPGISTTRLGRVGVSDDIARVVLFCASDMAAFMSGTTLLVDGAEAA